MNDKAQADRAALDAEFAAASSDVTGRVETGARNIGHDLQHVDEADLNPIIVRCAASYVDRYKRSVLIQCQHLQGKPSEMPAIWNSALPTVLSCSECELAFDFQLRVQGLLPAHCCNCRQPRADEVLQVAYGTTALVLHLCKRCYDGTTEPAPGGDAA